VRQLVATGFEPIGRDPGADAAPRDGAQAKRGDEHAGSEQP
jgi:hypothetical protein